MDEISPAAHKAMLALTELFSNLPNSNNTNHHKYILELEDGQPVFPRDEICFAIDKLFDEILERDPEQEGDNIVPQKLAKLFPGSFTKPRC